MWGDLSIKPTLANELVPKNRFYISTMRTFTKAGFEKTYPLNPDNKQIIELLKKALEYQILLLEQ